MAMTDQERVDAVRDRLLTAELRDAGIVVEEVIERGSFKDRRENGSSKIRVALNVVINGLYVGWLTSTGWPPKYRHNYLADNKMIVHSSSEDLPTVLSAMMGIPAVVAHLEQHRQRAGVTAGD